MALDQTVTPRTPIDLILSAGSAIGLSDSQLVESMVRGRGDVKELAFRALLDRHGAMVWRVCRQLLRDAPDVDDAFQATFLVLIRRARTLRVSGSLGPWLYQVAWRVSLQARSSRDRVRATLSDQLDQAEQPVPDRRIGADAFRALHGELNNLPSKYRMPIVLCHLEGKTHEEAARTLRWPVGTLSGRLSRGRSLLRDSSDDVTLENAPPVVVKTSPEAGATEVDPNQTEIRVTFSKQLLDKTWSWSTATKNTFPKVTGDIHYLHDGRTCVLPVKLEPGKSYATWINSGRFNNFKDRDRRPAVPYLLVFETKH